MSPIPASPPIPLLPHGVTGARDCACSLCFSELGFSVDLVDTPIHPVIVATRGGAFLARHCDLRALRCATARSLSVYGLPVIPFQAQERNGQAVRSGCRRQ